MIKRNTLHTIEGGGILLNIGQNNARRSAIENTNWYGLLEREEADEDRYIVRGFV